MTSTTANGITLEYLTYGDPTAPPVLLIMGLAGQLTAWDPELCRAIADAGYYVVCFDNRDVGLSTWFDGVDTTSPSYSLSDMADDAVGLLDALGIDAAHVVGVSMGGMIAQTVAIEHPTRVLTLTSIMSTTGDPTVGQPTPDALAVLLAPVPATRDEAIELGVRVWRTIGSPGFEFDEAAVRTRVSAAYDRATNPAGAARQIQAIISQPDRTAALGSVDVPTLVIHGDADPLVVPSGGIATANAVPGATLKLVPGMGHDLPTELIGEFAAELTKHFGQA
jgi:pimeloyl-ACP methyl ester carboxylesterase